MADATASSRSWSSRRSPPPAGPRRRRTRPPPRARRCRPRASPSVSPCGPGTPGPSNEIGVTPEAITIGVVADVTGARAGFRSNWEAMQAFAAACNSEGGIAGRRLDVRLFDTNVFQHRQAITDACTSVFAIVGSAAAFDGDGSTVEADCGIPDVPAFVAEPAHARVPTLVSPLPSPQKLYLVGPLRYFARIAPLAVRHAAVAYLDVGVSAIRAARHVEAAKAVGYRFSSIDTIPALPSDADFDTIARHVSLPACAVPDRPGDHRGPGRGAERLSPAGTTGRRSSTRSGRSSTTLTTWRPPAPRPRAPTCSRRPRRSTTPRPCPSSGATSTGSSAPCPAPSRRPRACGAGRPGCCSPRRPGARPGTSTAPPSLARLRAVHAWDGNGIQIPTDPGHGRSSTCFAYVRVEGGGFQRAYPDRGFACPRDGWLRLRRDFTHL